ncbi:hypothetical protein FE784_03635 [Paenibacillus hemerocallicola]|uniref:Uncharacterized protein n=1 Tax=Paenibacillus hemerocallicola TaxID=1172614 RepID=A0A5C4TFV7_9BACL|nr:hypothetical protein [Paenibacillus hemerocallicola]TNJ67848.1 hypothetical protein FE784_03635 [Paenibacillus hemerocallicola]
MANTVPTLIPAPKQMRYHGNLQLDKSRTVIVEAGERAAPVTQTASRQLTAWLSNHWSGKNVAPPFDAEEHANAEGDRSYRIWLSETTVEREAATVPKTAAGTELRTESERCSSIQRARSFTVAAPTVPAYFGSQ